MTARTKLGRAIRPHRRLAKAQPAPSVVVALAAPPPEVTLALGDVVETRVPLLARPAGQTGTVRELGHPFVAVQFDEGRIGYYTRRQLRPHRGA